MSERYLGGFVSLSFNPLASPSIVGYFAPGPLYAWGANGYGQLAQNNVTYRSSPVQVGAESTWLKISAGYTHVAAIKSDGTLWGWGRNINGEIGNNNVVTMSSPVQVGSLTTWSHVTCGIWHTTAIKSDGTLWSWGKNSQGQLGTGNTTNFSSPVQIGALTDWAIAQAGSYFTLAVKTDGTLWSWGNGNFGSLGLGNTTFYSSPKQVGALTNWAYPLISGGAEGSGATKTDGTIWSWGKNNHGQLGTGNTTYYSSPKQVGALTNWLYYYRYSENSAAIKTDGTIWTWGRGVFGAIGDNTDISRSSPVQVGTGTWRSIVTGEGYTIAVKSDFSLWSWGFDGGSGCLGLNTRYNNKSSPTQIGALTTWTNVMTAASGDTLIVRGV